VNLGIQLEVSGMERSIVSELNQLRKTKVDKLFWENFHELSERIARKVPKSDASENMKRLVLTAYEHVCRKMACNNPPDWVLKTRVELEKAISVAKTH
jgi:hypothetical protein